MKEHLTRAKSKKDDEFYTLLPDIEKELCHYGRDFVGKHIHMPCDDYKVSNFWRYFYDNFSRLGLRKITAMHYTRDGSCSSLVSYDGVSLTVEPLTGDGAFQSEEGRSAIAACDIVVTNPPFSIWRLFLATLLDAKVSYIIVGLLAAAVATSVAFCEVSNRRMSVGRGGRISKFHLPGGGISQVAACFYTNIRPFSHSSPVALTAKFDPTIHEVYDDYDAINCNRSSHIPKDYPGAIGVPISFITKLCPEQFEILDSVRPSVRGREVFARLLIRNKQLTPAHKGLHAA